MRFLLALLVLFGRSSAYAQALACAGALQECLGRMQDALAAMQSEGRQRVCVVLDCLSVRTGLLSRLCLALLVLAPALLLGMQAIFSETAHATGACCRPGARQSMARVCPPLATPAGNRRGEVDVPVWCMHISAGAAVVRGKRCSRTCAWRR